MKRLLFNLFFLVALTISLPASAQSPVLANEQAPLNDAAKVLEACTVKMASLTSYLGNSEAKDAKGITTSTKLFFRKMPDGTIETRFEITGSQKHAIKLIQIGNASGQWMIFESKKIAISLQRLQTQVAANDATQQMMADKEWRALPSTYSEETRTIDNRSLIVVRQNLSDDVVKALGNVRASVDAANGTTASPSGSSSARIPAVLEYYIGRDDNLLYGENMYTASGDKFSGYYFDSFTADIPLDDNLFVVPPTFQQFQPKTNQELGDLMIKGLR